MLNLWFNLASQETFQHFKRPCWYIVPCLWFKFAPPHLQSRGSFWHSYLRTGSSAALTAKPCKSYPPQMSQHRCSNTCSSQACIRACNRACSMACSSRHVLPDSICLSIITRHAPKFENRSLALSSAFFLRPCYNRTLLLGHMRALWSALTVQQVIAVCGLDAMLDKAVFSASVWIH